MENAVRLAFEGGTVAVTGELATRLDTLPGVRHDPRSGSYRAEGRFYRAIVERLRELHIAYQDEARAYQPSAWKVQVAREPFPHQSEGLETWWQSGGRGVVVLPTGTGKTFLAVL